MLDKEFALISDGLNWLIIVSSGKFMRCRYIVSKLLLVTERNRHELSHCEVSRFIL